MQQIYTMHMAECYSSTPNHTCPNMSMSLGFSPTPRLVVIPASALIMQRLAKVQYPTINKPLSTADKGSHYDKFKSSKIFPENLQKNLRAASRKPPSKGSRGSTETFGGTTMQWSLELALKSVDCDDFIAHGHLPPMVYRHNRPHR